MADIVFGAFLLLCRLLCSRTCTAPRFRALPGLLSCPSRRPEAAPTTPTPRLAPHTSWEPCRQVWWPSEAAAGTTRPRSLPRVAHWALERAARGGVVKASGLCATERAERGGRRRVGPRKALEFRASNESSGGEGEEQEQELGQGQKQGQKQEQKQEKPHLRSK